VSLSVLQLWRAERQALRGAPRDVRLLPVPRGLHGRCGRCVAATAACPPASCPERLGSPRAGGDRPPPGDRVCDRWARLVGLDVAPENPCSVLRRVDPAAAERILPKPKEKGVPQKRQRPPQLHAVDPPAAPPASTAPVSQAVSVQAVAVHAPRRRIEVLRTAKVDAAEERRDTGLQAADLVAVAVGAAPLRKVGPQGRPGAEARRKTGRCSTETAAGRGGPEKVEGVYQTSQSVEVWEHVCGGVGVSTQRHSALQHRREHALVHSAAVSGQSARPACTQRAQRVLSATCALSAQSVYSACTRRFSAYSASLFALSVYSVF
jgi:hypothetical protein